MNDERSAAPPPESEKTPDYRKISKKELRALLKDRDACIRELTGELETQRESFRKLGNQQVRLEADFINFRKRFQKERQAIARSTKEDVIMSFLDVKTNLDRAFAQVEKATEMESLKKGLRMVESQLEGFLATQGVRAINDAGGPFDPNLQEAVTTVEDDSVKVETVKEIVEKGYMLGDKVIIPMKCIVSIPPENAG